MGEWANTMREGSLHRKIAEKGRKMWQKHTEEIKIKPYFMQ